MLTHALMAPVADMHTRIKGAKGSLDELEAMSFWDNVMPITNAEISCADTKSSIKTTCTLESEVAATAVTTDLQGVSIATILEHRYDQICDTCFEMRVRWVGGAESWEPEIEVQKHHKMTLFAYWDSLEGGREGAMVDRELWHVFEILSHTRGLGSRIYLEVIWVGSPTSSCEPEATIRNADKKLLEGYWKS
ncbi:chromo domain-containing protein [Colletotrichum scovillei]|nr:chromo domain-containing protein [Colletotrichum scovillei]